MKKIVLFSLLIVFATSCEKEWLDLEPIGQKFETNYYETEEEIFSGLVAAYSILQPKYYSGWSSYYFLANFPSDDAKVVGGGPGDRPEYHAIGNFNIAPTNPAVLQLWRRNFYGIYRANVVLANANPEASQKSVEYIAEAKFLRAYFYFELIRFFGDVPLITGTLSPDEYNRPRDPAEDVFAQIIADLTEAADDLPAKSQLAGDELYRATKGAANALLGKAYLYMASPYYQQEYDFPEPANNYYELAAAEFEKVINAGYELEDNYDDIWQYSHENGVESIFEIEYANIDRGGDWGNGRVNGGNIDVQMSGPRGISTDTLLAGWGFDMVSQDLIAAYEAEGDSARKYGTAYGEDFLTEIGASEWEQPEGYTGWYSKKRAPWAHLTSESSPEWNFETNERMIRYADVLLMCAEAYLQSGTGNPLPLVNQVRERAMPDDPLSSVTMEDIKLERRLELAMEGHRFFDLVRWGDAASELGELGFIPGKHEVFPIPQSEIDNSNGKLEQNSNY
ncbi:MAG: RagB/SusD family nutrient uptake outer membrane protein [Bacteroidales bacterium]|nr:RagB/SusD family nutrient uptake outer membrane protein [Bacteroidales bacterium]MCF8336389.1 RagB/SusD family nutrient uptake outer membrane protein [Bacteroidales bacterium]